ncbi:MAG: aspartate/glutamate racemase family protein [Gammaproteobacteria bacterium]
MDRLKLYYQSFVNRAVAEPYLRHLAGYLDSVKRQDTLISIGELVPPDEYAHALVEYRCGLQAISKAVEAEEAGFDAVILGHFQDSGLHEAKAALGIPVIGLGEVSMYFACTMADRFGLVTLNPRFIPIHEHQVVRYGLERRVVGVRALRFQPGEFTSAFDDPGRIAAAVRSLQEQARPLVDAGAELIIPAGGIPMLACGKMGKVEVDGVPVLDALPVVLKFAEMAVELKKQSGIHISRKGLYCQPPKEVIQTAVNLIATRRRNERTTQSGGQ